MRKMNRIIEFLLSWEKSIHICIKKNFVLEHNIYNVIDLTI